MTEEVNGVTLQLLEDGHVGFPTAMSGDALDRSFTFENPSSARPPSSGLSIVS